MARESTVCFRKSKSVLNFSRALFDYILFFLPSTHCFSHIVYNSCLLINRIELMWPIFGGLLWFLKTKFQPPPESFAESLPVVTSDIMSFRRRVTVRGNDLLAVFSCGALLKDFHMDLSFNQSRAVSSNMLNWRYGIPPSRMIPSPTREPQSYPNSHINLKLICVAVDSGIV